MPEPRKWGFTPGERRALLLICAAILAGVGYQAWQRCQVPATPSLTLEDSLGLAAITASVEASSTEAFPPEQIQPSGRLNVNRATCEQLETLPGIGPALARRIAAVRDSLGGFQKVEDLLAVPGIGFKRLERIRPLVTCEPDHSR